MGRFTWGRTVREEKHPSGQIVSDRFGTTFCSPGVFFFGPDVILGVSQLGGDGQKSFVFPFVIGLFLVMSAGCWERLEPLNLRCNAPTIGRRWSCISISRLCHATACDRSWSPDPGKIGTQWRAEYTERSLFCLHFTSQSLSELGWCHGQTPKNTLDHLCDHL